MKTQSIWFLRAVLLVLGGAAGAIGILVLPRVIGNISLGGYDPILLSLYISLIPFYVALYQSWKLLSLIRTNNAFSELAVLRLRAIAYSAGFISVLYTLGLPYIFYIAGQDDAPGVVVIALVFIFAATTIAVFAGILRNLLQNVVSIKKENEYTI